MKFETLTAVTHLLITKFILKLAGICGFCNVNTRAVQKVSDLWSAKIELIICRSEILIPFKVVSLVMHTLLQAVLPLLETFLESFLWNHVQQVCRVPFS